MVPTTRIVATLALLLCGFWSPPFCPVSRAGTISLSGYDAAVYLSGADYYYPTGASTALMATSSAAPANSSAVDLSLPGSATDNIVSVSGKATLKASQTINADGSHATADIKETGTTSTTGTANYQAQVLAQSSAYWTFTLTGSAWLHYDYSGSANLIHRDPSGFDGYTYTYLGSTQGFLPGLQEWSPMTFSKSGTILLGPGTYTVYSYQQSTDTQNPYYPGTYSESTSSTLDMSLQATPEPASLILLGLGGLGLAGYGWRRRKVARSA